MTAPAADPLRYAVLPVGRVWRIFGTARRIGRFAAREQALAAALGLAREAEGAGRKVEILLQDDVGRLVPLRLVSGPAEVWGGPRGRTISSGSESL